MRTFGLLGALAICVALLACSSGGDEGGESDTPTPALTSPGESSAPPSSVFLIYRDASGNLIARDLAEGGKSYRQTVDFNTEVIVGASCVADGSGMAYLKQEFTETDREIVVHGEHTLDDRLFIPSTVQGIAWSPDGTRIALTDYDGFEQVHTVHVLDIESGEMTELSAGPDFAGSIAWSRDGSRIAYYIQRIAAGDTSIFTMTPEGEDKTELSNPDIQWFDPDWSVDSQRILAAGLSGEVFQLYELDAETGESTQITESDIFKRGAKYSPDGGTIGYTGSIINEAPLVSLPAARALHSFGIFLMNSDGTNERAFTADPRLNPGAEVDPYLDAFLLGWCPPGPWLNEVWVEEEPEATQ